MRVLLVEDDELLGASLVDGLKIYKHVVDWVKDGEKGEIAIKNENFDVVVLDIGLPKKSGFEVLRNIRNEGINTPVLILTAHEETQNRVKGLDLGADDYLVKPFDIEELCARLRALQRRFSPDSRATSLIQYKNILLDPVGHTVKLSDEFVSLPRREFVLLHTLLENRGRALSRDYLTQAMYGWGYDVDSNAIEVHIHNLRKKFGSEILRTIRGVGYIIEKEDQDEE
jgi:two-component system response regulator QseB